MKMMKKSLALFLTLMLALSSLGVAAYAGDTPVEESAAVAGVPEMTARDSGKVVFTFKDAPEGTQMAVAIADYSADEIEEESWSIYTVTDDSITVANISNSLVPASQAYKVFARYDVDGSYEYVESSSFRFIPVAPEEISKSDTEVAFSAAVGCEYKLDDGKYTAEPSFKDLAAGSEHTLYFRFAAESEESAIKAGAEGKKVFKMKLGKPATPGKPVYVSCTMTTITVDKPDGYEGDVQYSIDSGKTWQDSGVFENLSKGTTYSIIARGAANDEQIEGEAGPAIKVNTASREVYTADKDFCIISVPEEDVAKGKTASITAKGSTASGAATEGDTRLVPVKWTAKLGEQVLGSGIWTDGKNTQAFGISTKEIEIPSGGSVIVTVTVEYSEEEYSAGEWQKTGDTVDKTENFKVVPVNYIEVVINAIASLFTGIRNAFQNIKNFINNFFNS